MSSKNLFFFFYNEFQNNGGVIINITATLSFRGRVLQTHAGSAKAAIGTNFLSLDLINKKNYLVKYYQTASTLLFPALT